MREINYSGMLSYARVNTLQRTVLPGYMPARTVRTSVQNRRSIKNYLLWPITALKYLLGYVVVLLVLCLMGVTAIFAVAISLEWIILHGPSL